MAGGSLASRLVVRANVLSHIQILQGDKMKADRKAFRTGVYLAAALLTAQDIRSNLTNTVSLSLGSVLTQFRYLPDGLL